MAEKVEAAAMGYVTPAVNSTEIPASRLKEIPALTETAARPAPAIVTSRLSSARACISCISSARVG